jgi:4-amino-4-deoxy-L-arabinose transferase-like glycosyltransferase
MPVAWPIVLVLAASKVVFQLVTADLYGAHRDEFYYLESGYHLAFGYVDNPPLVPWTYRLEQAAFGHSVISIAVVPALLGGVFVVLGALIAADLGGGRTAQGLCALVAWLGPLFLTTSHFLGTVSLDLVVWALASWLVIRMVRIGDTRWWMAIGAVCGIGLLNKDTILFWVVAAGAGLLFTPERRLLWSRWLVAGAAIACGVALPNLVWEANHGWATLVFLRNLRASNSSTDLVQFVPLQLLLVTVGGTVLWIVALIALNRRAEWRSQRWLAYGYGVAFVLILALGGKAYYLGSFYLPLVAVGAVVVERSWSSVRLRLLVLITVVLGLLGAPYATPVLPQSAAVAAHLDTDNHDLGGMLGWPQVVGQIAAAVDTLPATERRHVVIFADNYSQAGAVDFYGPALGLPPAVSGHNTFWLWGYGRPAPGATVIAVGLPAPFVHRYWTSVRLASTLGVGGPPIDPQERGAPVWICRSQRASWAAIWPAAKHYG